MEIYAAVSSELVLLCGNSDCFCLLNRDEDPWYKAVDALAQGFCQILHAESACGRLISLVVLSVTHGEAHPRSPMKENCN